MTDRPSTASALAIAGWLLCLFLPTAARAEWFSEGQDKMGTRVEIELWQDDEPAARQLIRAGMAEFDRIEAYMSTYRENSEISRVNRLAATAPVPVSRELYDIVQVSLDISARSGGAFDITFDSVGRLYDFRAGVRPDAAAIHENLPAINYRHVVLDPAATTIRFTMPGTRINLGGIGKGFACEKVASLLRAAGVTHARVNAGGDTRFIGDHMGRPWVVGVRDPDDEHAWITRLTLDNEAISTAGDYERFFDKDGVRYHHIIDPKTGDSARGVRSVSVIGPDGTITDGIDDVAFIMGPERGLAFIESFPGYDAVIVDDKHRVYMSKGLQAR